MKYELETNIKRISFPCPEMGFRVNHGKCVKCSIVNNPNDCWEKNVRKEIQQDCDIENEQNAEAYAVCPRLCATCGCPFSLDTINRSYKPVIALGSGTVFSCVYFNQIYR